MAEVGECGCTDRGVRGLVHVSDRSMPGSNTSGADGTADSGIKGPSTAIKQELISMMPPPCLSQNRLAMPSPPSFQEIEITIGHVIRVPPSASKPAPSPAP